MCYRTHVFPWDPDFARRSSWHRALDPIARTFSDAPAFPTCEALTALADARARSRPSPRFELQAKVPKRRRSNARVDVASRYDGRVALTGAVPTRAESWHDFYNALVFIELSRAKRALHARQFHAAEAAIGKDAVRVPGRRTREQDHLTILDEGSVLVACATGRRQETELALRANGPAALESDALRAVVFGHAIYEHFHYGRPPVRAMTIVLELPRAPSEYAPEALLDALDVALCAEIESPGAFMDPSGAFSMTIAAER
jgi:hypothetical protein